LRRWLVMVSMDRLATFAFSSHYMSNTIRIFCLFERPAFSLVYSLGARYLPMQAASMKTGW